MRALLSALLALFITSAHATPPNTTSVPTTLQNTPCTATQLLYGAGSGVAPACLNLGTGLSITTGTLNASASGSVSGPGSSTSGDLAIWNNTSGTLLKDQSLTATLDAAIGSTQGSIMYRNSTVWTPLTPGTSGYVLTTQGSSADPIWSNVSGGTGCTVSGGSQYNLLVNNGSSGCSSDTNARANAGALSLGASGTAGSVIFGNATSGTVTLQTVTGALGSVTLSLPAATATLATTANINTALPNIAATHLYGGSGGAGVASDVTVSTGLSLSGGVLTNTFGNGCTVSGGSQYQILVNNGSSGCSSDASASVNAGSLTLGASGTAGLITMGNATSGTVVLQPVTGALGNVTASLPANTGTIAELNLAQTWTAVQTYNNSTIRELGSSTGYTTFTSANAGASNYTMTVPAVTDTLATLNTPQTFTGTLTLNGTSSTFASILANAAEPATISATAATGTINYYINSQSILYYTSNASANWTTNLAFSSGTTMNTALATGQVVTAVFMVTQGSTAYYNTAIQIDGTTSGVTTLWQGGTAPSAGNANGVDVYTYTIIKTGSAAYTVFASQTQY